MLVQLGIFTITFLIYSLIFGYQKGNIQLFKKIIAHLLCILYLSIFHGSEYFNFYRMPEYKYVNYPYFYLVEIGYYFQDIIYYVYNMHKERKISGSSTIMILHHIVTMLMLYLSYDKYFCVFGYIVLWNHMIDDVISHSAKLIKYIYPQRKVVYKVLFYLSNLTWIWHRIVKQGILISSIIFNIYKYHYDYNYDNIFFRAIDEIPNGVSNTIYVTVLLVIIWIANIIWWLRQLEMVKRDIDNCNKEKK